MRRLALSAALASSLAVATPGCDSETATTTPGPSDTTSGTDTSTGGGGGTTDATTGGGGGTDTTGASDTTAPGAPRTVASLQAEAEDPSLGACDAATAFRNVNPAVTVSGVVVTSPKFTAYKNAQDATNNLDGYYVSDPAGGPWTGILVTIPATENSAYAVGDTLEVTGQLVDYFCNTQISASTHKKLGTATAPAPLVVTAAQATDEALEGVVVTVQGIKVIAKPNVYQVEGADGTAFEVGIDFGREGFFISLDIGATYDVTGVMKFGFGKRQIMPMGPEGIVKTSADPELTIKGIQGATQSTACAGEYTGPTGTLTGTVASAKFSISAGLDGYFVTDGTSEPFSGIQVVVPKAANTAFVPGDVVQMTGKHKEFYCMSQFSVDTITKTGDGGTVPEAAALANDLSQEDFEKYEGMLVAFSNITIGERFTSTQANEQAKPFTTNGTPLIDWSLLSGMGDIPAVGTVLSTLRGFVRESYETRRVAPRSAADMVSAN
jgi:predicted extracellular nuclease